MTHQLLLDCDPSSYRVEPTAIAVWRLLDRRTPQSLPGGCDAGRLGKVIVNGNVTISFGKTTHTWHAAVAEEPTN
jgi:hypothetical protein